MSSAKGNTSGYSVRQWRNLLNHFNCLLSFFVYVLNQARTNYLIDYSYFYMPKLKKDRTIVFVTSSFANSQELFLILSKYARHADKHFAYWDEFAFTTDIVPECDAILVFNTPYERFTTRCYPENVIVFMMEPGNKTLHSWMFKQLDQYNKVYSPIIQSSNTVPSHGFLGWNFQRNYNYLRTLPRPVKTKMISCVASSLTQLPGHQKRNEFVGTLKEKLPEIDFFGRGRHFIPDKMNALRDYHYSIAIENTSATDYFTEKINDCFLTYTIPIYYGCNNISKYFPEKSFVKINIDDVANTIETITSLIARNDWEERLPYLEEARNLVLNKYQPLAGASDILRQIKISKKKMIVLRGVQPGLSQKIKKAVAKIFKH